MKRFNKLFLVLVVMGLVLVGCNSNGGDTADTAGTDTADTADTSNANGDTTTDTDSSDPVEYVVVLGPNDAGQIQPGSQAIIDEMNIALEPYNASVSYVHVDDYSVVSESILSGTGHIGFGSGATYVTASLENENVKPLFTYAEDGDIEKAGYPGYVGVNSTNAGEYEGLEGDEALEALKGKSFAFVSATSTSGRVVPTTNFWGIFGPEGTGEVEDKSAIFESTIDDGGIFSEVQFTGSHPASVEMLVNDRIDAAAFCCEFGTEAIENGDVTVIYEQIVPGDPFWANYENMDEEHIEAIISHFENLTPENAASEALFAPEGEEDAGLENEYAMENQDRFIRVEPSYYEFLVSMFAEEQ